MTTTHELLDRLRKTARTPQERGELFERFVIAYLRCDSYYGQFFSNVWRWRDWPGRGSETDSGIDIVAEERDTGVLWAIQAKFHEAQLGLHDIATFLALSGRKEFARRMIVTTSSLGPKAEEALKEQDKPVKVLTLASILQRPIDWDTFDWNRPEDFQLRSRKQLHPYQKEAVEAVLNGFGRSDRGKLIMPPGSGKTFVALKIAEKLVGPGGYVLFLAPSIALVEQTLQAWLADAEVSLRVYAVTSDYTVGRDEDAFDRTTVLTIPPTTEATELAAAAGEPDQVRMTVIVSTYHSIDVVAEAQKLGLPDFGLIVADEAHRTTGVMQGEEASYYHKIHDNNVICGAKRLYMTATPRVFVPRIKKKLEELGYDYFTMDDKTVYGEEFFRYGFGQAVDEGFLSDYKVVVFTVSEADLQRRLFEFLSREGSPKVEDAAKIVGVWSVLSGRIKDGEVSPLKRAVVFAGRSIGDSKKFAEQFVKTAEAYHEAIGSEGYFRRFEVKHIDGTMTSTERKALLDWLRGEPGPGETRVLSNAKVLTEGVDVPALDAVVFLKPRRSVVEVVQAVGRAMRKAPGKRYGYVVLPVIVDPERDAAEQLDKNEEFRTVWEVLGALRSIDDRFDARVRQLWIQRTRGKREKTSQTDEDVIIVSGPEQLSFDFGDKILGRLVERVGERVYLELWAKDVAAVSARLERHIAEALQHDSEYGEKAREAFAGFLAALREVINPSVAEEDARSMLVQHIITKPIFDAIFGEYEFLKENPVAHSFDQLASVFETFVDKETKTLKKFYHTVQTRAKGLDKETERQEFLRQLYDTFFKVAFPKTADRLGIVFTPVEVVDFLVKSAEAVLEDEFGLSLADKNVVILEPFAGTGTFLVRLMHQLPPKALVRKYRKGEIWGNEILLLPYYIALANVESTYYELTGQHEPFRNLLLVDSFQLMEARGAGQIKLFPEQYTELMKKQREAKINVIISNPPWFAWQEEENLGMKAVKYDRLDERIRRTYAAYSLATNKNSLYDSYIRAIRMATDRIEDKGVIAFVTNSGFLDGSAADGLRKCLAEEFAKIYVLNLRGNARTSGELRRKEGGGIFGQGSRAGVVLLVLVKDTSKAGPAEIYYRDIGDYLSREEKLARLKACGDVRGVTWKRITPNKAYDWINQRSEDFEAFPAIGAKQNGDKEIIFDLHSRGLATSRDAWAYNFSQAELADNLHRMIDEFNRHVELVRTGKIRGDNLESQINTDPRKIAWSRELKKDLLKGNLHTLEEAGVIMPSTYRPFVKMWVYFSKTFNEMIYQQPKIFPEPGLENIAIAVQAPGGSKEFSALIIKHIPDLHLTGDTQTFSFYIYEPVQDNITFFDSYSGGGVMITAPSGKRYIRRENITDWALEEYRKRYGGDVTKEDIFYYVYGLLHSPEYRERYRNDLKKTLPRIPFVASAEDFWAFSHAGRKLAELHLNYETVEPWPLGEEIKGNPGDFTTYRVTKMRFGKVPDGKEDKTVIIYNDQITLRGIPVEAYEYVVNGKSPIEWIIDRYHVFRDKKSGIVNDPNKWLEEQGNPRYIIDLIKRVVRVSVETVEIVKGLPKLDIEASGNTGD
ncbi:type ISP restriction/modification enzyme [Desulfofundulus salinus]|uniref:DEAD/DEAH box helicase n=1 Tax=Desulfofundulus salinus TaxID=2419843 RepID=A0A494WXX3_9FIRM|nr:type ISP restriction/modification enzyme [Desulfofundulus salinum]RKO65727.1 DEAD/DEAH box helicase [Desulfofundulus salinum]